MTIKLNLKYLVGVIVLILAVSIFLYMLKSRYTISDVTADNYKKMLKPSNETILSVSDGISTSLPGNVSSENRDFYTTRFNLSSSDLISERENEYEKVGRTTANDMLYVEYANKLTKIRCQGNWKGLKEKILVSCAINDMGYKGSFDPNYKIIADKLILSEGFILKESSLRAGNDILIKDNDNNFIIAELWGSYSRNEIVGLFISTFSKKKYF